MEEEIINRVANSKLEVFDLEDYYPQGIQSQIDISMWLLGGLLLKEKEFRLHLKGRLCYNLEKRSFLSHYNFHKHLSFV